MPLLLCGIPPQNTLPQSNDEKNIKQSLVEGHSAKYLTKNSQNFQSHQNQGKFEKPS